MTWTLLGNGCDKKFYVEGAAGGYGAICCTTVVAARETKAYIDLKNLDLTIIPTILPWTYPGGIDTGSGVVKPQYMIERLNITGTFKPQMCALVVFTKVKKMLAEGNREHLLASFNEIELKLDRICKIVGELTLCVDKTTGKLFMLDFSPAENGNRAINQIDTIRTGIANIKASLGAH